MASDRKRGRPPMPPAERRKRVRLARECRLEILAEAENLRLLDRPPESAPPYQEAFAIVAERRAISERELKRLLDEFCDVVAVRGDPVGGLTWKPDSAIGRLAASLNKGDLVSGGDS